MAGQVVINSLAGFTGAETVGETVEEAQLVADLFRSAWQAHLLIRLSNQYAFLGATARGMRNPLLSAFSPATVAAGSLTGAALPTFAAVKVKLQTGTPGPAGRGRTGLTGGVEDASGATTANTLTSVARADYQLGVDNFIAALLAATPSVKLSVISRFLGTDAAGKPIPRVAGPLASFVTSAIVMPTLGTRVSRLR
jgi:hypothetical protein